MENLSASPALAGPPAAARAARFGGALSPVAILHSGARGETLVYDLAGTMFEDGRRHDAKLLLSGVYGRFTEGFETRDLVRARELLHSMDG